MEYYKYLSYALFFIFVALFFYFNVRATSKGNFSLTNFILWVFFLAFVKGFSGDLYRLSVDNSISEKEFNSLSWMNIKKDNYLYSKKYVAWGRFVVKSTSFTLTHDDKLINLNIKSGFSHWNGEASTMFNNKNDLYIGYKGSRVYFIGESKNQSDNFINKPYRGLIMLSTSFSDE